MALLSQYKSLGVINRTPDSFSDHGLSLKDSYFKNQLECFLADPTIIIDVGFESTAPMNQAISSRVELERFDNFLAASKSFDIGERFISFDTYRPANFLLMALAFKKIHRRVHFIFNDVSGVLDDELKNVLLKFKGKNFYYIYTFSHIPDRSAVLDHMKYLDSKKNIIFQTSQAFLKTHQWFLESEMESHLILDPGFGFSKTFEQNWQLINQWQILEKSLLESGIHLPMVIGLSKKSFLKKFIELENSPQSLEELHQKCISQIKKNSQMDLFFRMHEPKLLV